MEYIVDRDCGETSARKDANFRGLIVRCRGCVYFRPDEDGKGGICNRKHIEKVRRMDYCSRGKAKADYA